MQINITQYVLVRIPRNMGLFDAKDNDEYSKVQDEKEHFGTAINEDPQCDDYQKAWNFLKSFTRLINLEPLELKFTLKQKPC